MVLPAPGHLFENQKDSKGISLDLRHIITIRLLKPCHAERPCTSRSLISTSTPISCDSATLPKNHNGRNGPSISLSNKKSSDCVIPHQSKGFAMKITNASDRSTHLNCDPQTPSSYTSQDGKLITDHKASIVMCLAGTYEPFF